MSYSSYVPKMKCIAEPYEIYGDFNTNIANNLMATFTKCDPKVRSCKSNDEIEQWIDSKYLMIVENE